MNLNMIGQVKYCYFMKLLCKIYYKLYLMASNFFTSQLQISICLSFYFVSFFIRVLCIFLYNSNGSKSRFRLWYISFERKLEYQGLSRLALICERYDQEKISSLIGNGSTG